MIFLDYMTPYVDPLDSVKEVINSITIFGSLVPIALLALRNRKGFLAGALLSLLNIVGLWLTFGQQSGGFGGNYYMPPMIMSLFIVNIIALGLQIWAYIRWGKEDQPAPKQ